MIAAVFHWQTTINYGLRGDPRSSVFGTGIKVICPIRVEHQLTCLLGIHCPYTSVYTALDNLITIIKVFKLEKLLHGKILT